MQYKLKKWATIGVSSLLIASQALYVQADTAEDIAYLEQQQAETNAELSAVQSTINELENQKSTLLAQIDSYDKELISVLASIDLLDTQIQEKEEELVQTGKDLKQAEADRDLEYEAMKERIRYVYEEGGQAGWASLLLTGPLGGLSDILDKADYTQKLYDYDRQELDSYTESVARVDELQQQQLSQKASLQTMKREQESGKAYLEELLEQTELESRDTDARIADANALAAQYVSLIEEQNAAISELYARQEAERRAAEEAAARAAAQRTTPRVAASVIDSVQNEESASSGTSESADASESSASDFYEESATDVSETWEETASDAQSAADEYGDTYEESISYEEEYVEESYYEEPTSYGGVSGQDVVNLALQYVGNPYVWGGTNPATGADCSGFVQAIYGMLGYSISRTSYTQLNDGISVSYADAQPGDIINYGHHVAIYMGNGAIVHAANEQLGICTSTNAAYQPIVDVRRIIY